MVLWSADANAQLGKVRVKVEDEVNGDTILTEVKSTAIFTGFFLRCGC